MPVTSPWWCFYLSFVWVSSLAVLGLLPTWCMGFTPSNVSRTLQCREPAWPPVFTARTPASRLISLALWCQTKWPFPLETQSMRGAGHWHRKKDGVWVWGPRPCAGGGHSWRYLGDCVELGMELNRVQQLFYKVRDLTPYLSSLISPAPGNVIFRMVSSLVILPGGEWGYF